MMLISAFREKVIIHGWNPMQQSGGVLLEQRLTAEHNTANFRSPPGNARVDDSEDRTETWANMYTAASSNNATSIRLWLLTTLRLELYRALRNIDFKKTSSNCGLFTRRPGHGLQLLHLICENLCPAIMPTLCYFKAWRHFEVVL